MACADFWRSELIIRFWVCGGSAISGSSIAKITLCLSSAMIDSRANTSVLIVPVPWC
ncbi:hypothetical protein D3C76_1437520 [compost metagenome]